MSTQQPQVAEQYSRRPGRILWIALGVYLAWTVATYLLEGRINLLQQVDPAGRASYTLVANIFLGTVVALLAMQIALKAKLVTFTQMGLRSIGQTLKAVVVAVLLGVGFLVVQGPPSLSPVVLLNGFAQALPTSIAEVVVCWVVAGVSVEAVSPFRSRILAAVMGMAVAIVLFAIYHFAHSAPFNQVWMVFSLMLPAVGTSLAHLLGRNLYATAIFHNFLGLYGVRQTIELTPFSQPLIPLYGMMFISVVALVSTDFFVRRQVRKSLQLE